MKAFQFEAAEASFRLLLEGAMGTYHEFFRLERYRVLTERNPAGDVKSQATVCLLLDGKISEATADGPGPVQALEHALRDSLSDAFESLASVQLTDYKVRVLDADGASAARVRVLIQSQDNDQSWSTVGVSDNIIDASWQALVDAINYKLLRTHGGLEKAASLG